MTTIENNDAKPAAESNVERAVWVKPAIQRMTSGSAEAGGAANPDGGIGQS